MEDNFSEESELFSNSTPSSNSISPISFLPEDSLLNQIFFESNLDGMTNFLFTPSFSPQPEFQNQIQASSSSHSQGSPSPAYFNSFSYPFLGDSIPANQIMNPVVQNISNSNLGSSLIETNQIQPPSNLQSLDNMELPPESKKRKRVLKGELISNACQVCRQKHTKCNGQTPCATCKKGKLECIYLPRQRKKTPKEPKKQKTKTQKLEELVQILSQQVVKPNYIQEQLNVSSDLMNYVSAYRHNIEPFFGVSSSLLPSNFLSDDDIPDPIKFASNCLLASGALSLGDSENSNRFALQARSLLPSVFDLTDLYTAAGYSLLSFYYLKSGQFDKCRSSSALAKSIAEILRQGQSVHPSTHSIFYGTLIHTIKTSHSRSEQLKEITKVVNDLLMREKQSLIDNSRFNFFKSLTILWKILILLVVGMDQQGYSKLHSIVDSFETVTMKFSQTPMRDLVLPPKTARAFIHFKQGNLEEAKALLEKTSEELLQCQTQFPGLLFCLNICTVLNLKLGNYEAIKKNLMFASKYKRFFPVIPKVMDLLFRDETFRENSLESLLTLLPLGSYQVRIVNNCTLPEVYEEMDQLSLLLKSFSVS